MSFLVKARDMYDRIMEAVPREPGPVEIRASVRRQISGLELLLRPFIHPKLRLAGPWELRVGTIPPFTSAHTVLPDDQMVELTREVVQRVYDNQHIFHNGDPHAGSFALGPTTHPVPFYAHADVLAPAPPAYVQGPIAAAPVLASVSLDHQPAVSLPVALPVPMLDVENVAFYIDDVLIQSPPVNNVAPIAEP